MDKIFYVPVPEEEFYQKIGESVYAAFLRNKSNVSDKKDCSKWLTHVEAAAYLKKTPAALYKISSMRDVKFTKRGKQNFYRVEDLDTYMEMGLVKTKDEIVRETYLIQRKKQFNN